MSQDFQPTAIQQELVTLATNVDLIRRFRYNDADYEVLARELVPAVETVTAELTAILDRIEEHYRVDDHGDADVGPIDGAMVAELCMMSRQELGERLTRLTGLTSESDGLDIITRSMALLGTLRRTAVAVENSLADQAEVRRRLRSKGELDLLLEIRATAVQIAQALGVKEPTAAELSGRLRDVGGILAELIGRDLYWELPASERTAVHDLQGRILLWVGGGDGFDSISGRHLWRALRGLAGALIKVNERGELIEYDRSIIRMAHSTLFGRGNPPPQVSASLLKQLRRIAGRDSGIDRLLIAGASASTEWEEPLQRLREAL
ncbi:MAG: hypothetical protein R3B09_16755 [Nannocystaceae bacterium]